MIKKFYRKSAIRTDKESYRVAVLFNDFESDKSMSYGNFVGTIKPFGIQCIRYGVIYKKPEL